MTPPTIPLLDTIQAAANAPEWIFYAAMKSVPHQCRIGVRGRCSGTTDYGNSAEAYRVFSELKVSLADLSRIFVADTTQRKTHTERYPVARSYLDLQMLPIEDTKAWQMLADLTGKLIEVRLITDGTPQGRLHETYYPRNLH